VKENVVAKTTRPKNNSEHTVTYLTKSEIKKLFKAVDTEENEYIKLRNKTILSLGFATALRCSAVTNLNVEDIDFQNKTIRVIEKGNKEILKPFSENLECTLKEWLDVRQQGLEHGPLFYSKKGTRISTDAINDMLKKYVKIAKIDKHITFHKCRSSVAVNALSAGVPLIAVSKMLSHSNIAVTNRYIDVINEDKIKMTNLADSWI